MARCIYSTYNEKMSIKFIKQYQAICITNNFFKMSKKNIAKR